MRLEQLHQTYNRLKEELDQAGFNAAVFDARIAVARRPERIEGFDQQVQKLVKEGAFSANNQWHYLGNHIGNSEVITTAQLICVQMAQDKSDKAAKEKDEQRQKGLEKAPNALAKFNISGDVSMINKDWQDVIRWVLPESKVPGLLKNLKSTNAVKEFLGKLEKPWGSYIPPRAAAQTEVEIENVEKQ